eukprot:m.203683 g.203683  ORF g.203683 m.203683 type:complete len:610 (-) comp32859_c2_seq1:47-1876(-)
MFDDASEDESAQEVLTSIKDAVESITLPTDITTSDQTSKTGESVSLDGLVGASPYNPNLGYHGGEEEYDSEDDDDDYEYYFDAGANSTGMTKQINSKPGPNSAKNAVGGALQPTQHAMGKFYHKIKVEQYDGPKLQDSAVNKVLSTNKKIDASRLRTSDKSDRATTEQVLDPRTRMILFKMLKRGIFHEINGCVSTGKEANVYHATDHEKQRDYAVKIFKTSILVFKDRDKYVTGEFRFRKGYNKHNPRKMVKVWAEKEFRNLSRLTLAGVHCPEPVMLRSHVLVMSFFGTDGWASPKLKDAKISDKKARELYLGCVHILRNMYQKAKLVHGDFSEYNILLHQGELVVIDVSQSVEHAHPNALEFLRMDIKNINDFFVKRGVLVMSLRDMFDFITDITITDDTVDDVLVKIQDKLIERDNNPLSREDEVEEQLQEAIFRTAYIPTSLDGVEDVARDIHLLQQGKGDQLFYGSLTGIVAATPNNNNDDSQETVLEDVVKPITVTSEPNVNVADSASSTTRTTLTSGIGALKVTSELVAKDNQEDDGGDDVGDAEDDEWHEPPAGTVRNAAESAEEKRARKQAIKEANREKRKNKTPKHVKKRHDKQLKHN